MGGRVHEKFSERAHSWIDVTYPSRYSRMTVLSLRERGGVYVFSLSPGTRPLGETSRRSWGFLYGSTSSARSRQPAVKKREKGELNNTVAQGVAKMKSVQVNAYNIEGQHVLGKECQGTRTRPTPSAQRDRSSYRKG